MWMFLVLSVALLCGALALRLVFVLGEHPLPALKSASSKPLTICVVLGSGGHTGEMIASLRLLPKGAWANHRPFYVASQTDKDSAGVAQKFESEVAQRNARVIFIPRAREVGQSYATSVLTTLKALAACVALVWREEPDVILTNGPGVCIPVIGASLLVCALTLRRRPAYAYFESFTCVAHLSLSGKLLLPVVDIFTVQWGSLAKALQRRQWSSTPGIVWNTGPRIEEAPNRADDLVPNDDEAGRLPVAAAKELASPASGGDTAPSSAPRRQVVITVGSTKFDELMEAVDSTAFLCELRQSFSATHCLVQCGRSSYEFRTLPKPGTGAADVCGVSVEVVSYKPFLQDDMRQASLVISHAGAGTILECLTHQIAMVVVPNERLMSNHQLELAHALHAARHLFVVPVSSVCDQLGVSVDLTRLRRFPGANRDGFRDVMQRVLRRQL